MIREAIVELYVHKVPHFKKKWRLIRPFAPLLNGLPVRSKYGVGMYLDLHDRTNGFCILGKYGDMVAREVSSLEAGDCFIDVGANCGLFTLIASRAVGPTGQVIAFEPSPKTFGALVRNLTLNEAENVLPINMAVAPAPAPLRLTQRKRRHSGSASISVVGDGPVAKPVHGVSLERFAALDEVIGGRRTTVKIDVEGFELMVVQGLMDVLKREQTTKVIIEIDDDHLRRHGAASSEIYERMSALGYVASFAEETGRHYDEIFTRPDRLGAIKSAS